MIQQCTMYNRLRLGLLALGFAAADAKPVQAALAAPSWAAKAPTTCKACVAAGGCYCIFLAIPSAVLTFLTR